MDTYAILIDGPFAIKVLDARLKRFPTLADLASLVGRVASSSDLAGWRCLRTYFYHAWPAKGRIRNPIDGVETDLATTEVFRKHTELIRGLEMMSGVAVRLGEVSVDGWKLGHAALRASRGNQERVLGARDLIPDIKQKGVDLRIGLDIARLALTGRVQAIVVVTGDSDFVPAFKFARREGVQVILDSLGRGTKRELQVHADGVIDLTP